MTANAANAANSARTDSAAALLPELGADYRDAVYAALADLPSEEIADALEEVETNLVEVVSELTAEGREIGIATLRARLGTPREYAAEFRAAAGYPPAVGRSTDWHVTPDQLAVVALFVSAAFALVCGIAVIADAASWIWGFSALVTVVFAALPGSWLRTQPPSLDAVPPSRLSFRAPRDTVAAGPGRLGRPSRPGRLSGELRSDLVDIARLWWVVVAVGLGVAVHKADGSPVAGTVVAVVALLPCVRLGRRVTRTLGRDRRLLWLAVPLTAFTIGLGVGTVFDEVRGRTHYYEDLGAHHVPGGLGSGPGSGTA